MTPIRARRIASHAADGGGAGGVVVVDLVPPCGPPSVAKATPGMASANAATRHRVVKNLLTFFMAILLLFIAAIKLRRWFRVKVI
jgi:hypothetical protein